MFNVSDNTIDELLNVFFFHQNCSENSARRPVIRNCVGTRENPKRRFKYYRGIFKIEKKSYAFYVPVINNFTVIFFSFVLFYCRVVANISTGVTASPSCRFLAKAGGSHATDSLQ